jgi:hypothetical protein
MWKIRLCVSIAALLLYCQSPALAQSPCMPAEAGLDFVNEKYGENPLFEGQMAEGRRFVLTWNAESGSWSLLVAHPADPGLLCMVGSGEGGKPAGGRRKPPGAPS